MRKTEKPSPSVVPSRQREALLEAVDYGSQVPGEVVKEALYARIERSYHVKREEIPEKLETFHLALEELMGASANVMERLIARDLYGRLGLDFKQNSKWGLVDYVEHANKT